MTEVIVSTVQQRERYYASLADKMERDPYGPDGAGRAVVVNGRGFARWQRFHPGETLTWVADIDGRMVALTPAQTSVLLYVRQSRSPETMRSMGQTLRLSPSTVSRALVKLSSYGLIAYLTGRGRYAGTVIIQRIKGDGLDRFRDAAKAKVRTWKVAAERRISRLQLNVALYVREEKRYGDSLYYYLRSLERNIEPAWTAEELREVGL